jgi:hypothetical protein
MKWRSSGEALRTRMNKIVSYLKRLGKEMSEVKISLQFTLKLLCFVKNQRLFLHIKNKIVLWISGIQNYIDGTPEAYGILHAVLSYLPFSDR